MLRACQYYKYLMRKYLKEGQYSIDQENILGKGAFGKVYRAYDHAQARWVAIKSINLQLLQIHGAEMKTIICNEISVMRKFTARMLAKPCPYLVKHYDCLRTDTHVYIVMELCQAGTLNDLISKQALTQQTVKSILKQVIAGLEYLDSLNISHRDLKPENIFVTVEFVNAKNVTYYKIGDFGFAAQKQTSSQVLGTYPFMAPEIYRREEYTSKVDVWSLGVIAYQLLFKELFFFGKNKWEIEKKVKDVQFSLEGRLKGRISAEMEDFISLCLSKDQLKRPRSCELMGLRLFSQGQTKLLVVFEAVEHELFFCELLRSMAEEVCEFGSRSSSRTEFMQIYLLKKSYSIVNLLAYSLLNKQNYLNVSEEMFGVLISQNHSKDYLVLCDKVTKESILVTSLFKEKYALFQHYLTKFALEDAKLVKSLIAADQLYADINAAVFKAELKNLSELLQKCPEYEVLKVKCTKLLQL